MADDKKPTRRRFFADTPIRILDPIDSLAAHHVLQPEDIQKFKDISMGCKVVTPKCPACEAGNKPRIDFQADYEFLEKRILASMKVPRHLLGLDAETKDIPEKIIGIDFGTKPDVMVTAVMTKLNEPNANGDIFVLDDPEYVGKFQPRLDIPVERDAQPLDVTKRNSVAERIKKLTDNYQQTRKIERNYGTPVIKTVLPLLFKIRELEKRLYEIQERSVFLTSDNAARMIMQHDLQREQYDLYRERQCVEAKLHALQERAEMERSEPRCPRCDSPMVLREARNGAMQGTSFYGCSNYPSCTGTRTKNEVEKDYPYFKGIKAAVAESGNNRYLELQALSPGFELIFAKRIHRTKFNGDYVFQEFIEPLSRAVGKPFTTIIFELMKGLDIPHASVITKRLVKTEPEVPHTHDHMIMHEVVDTIGLESIMETAKICQQLFGKKAHSELEVHRITLERRTNVIQLRAKNPHGQTICTGELPEERKEDIYALKELVTSFVTGLAEKVSMDQETIRQILVQDMEAAQDGAYQRTAALLHSAAMQINFVPRQTATGRFKHHEPDVPFHKMYKPQPQELHYIRFTERKHDVTLCAVNNGGAESSGMSHDTVTFDKHGAVRGFINAFVEMVRSEDDKFHPVPSKANILTALIKMGERESAGKAKKIGQVAECLRDEMHELRGMVKNPFISHKDIPLNRSSAMAEIYRQTYNPPPPQSCASDVAANMMKHSAATDRFIEAQRKAKPGRLVKKQIEAHERELADKALEQKTQQFKPSYCKKCGTDTGCMHPREPVVEEPLCQHRFLTRITPLVAGELGLKESEVKDKAIYACRDCHKFITRIPLTDPCFSTK